MKSLHASLRRYKESVTFGKSEEVFEGCKSVASRFVLIEDILRMLWHVKKLKCHVFYQMRLVCFEVCLWVLGNSVMVHFLWLLG